ncbi:hypothetical protein FS837_012782 [Tulasnella sp. UAMH 9824]|nr:hypothetical protein FS837_012782 [Tulasnella sp. UAMH 9824]
MTFEIEYSIVAHRPSSSGYGGITQIKEGGRDLVHALEYAPPIPRRLRSMGCWSSKQIDATIVDVVLTEPKPATNAVSPETNISTAGSDHSLRIALQGPDIGVFSSNVQASLPTGPEVSQSEPSGQTTGWADTTQPPASIPRPTRRSIHKPRPHTVVGGYSPPQVPGQAPFPPLPFARSHRGSAPIQPDEALKSHRHPSASTDPGRKSPNPSNHSTPKIQPRLEIDELWDRVSLASGTRSKRPDIIDHTGQLEEKTKPKFTGGFSDISQAKLGDRVVAVKELRLPNIESGGDGRIWKQLERDISVREIAEGLRYLHEQTPPIIHGDLKTTNVFVTGDNVVKIKDFGCSRRVDQFRPDFARTSLVLTTIRFAAPEVLRDGHKPSLSSDVFSFACVALETMTNKCPFWKIPNVVAVIAQVVFEKQTPSPEDHPDMDETSWELFRRCWNYEPSDRPCMADVCKMVPFALQPV